MLAAWRRQKMVSRFVFNSCFFPLLRRFNMFQILKLILPLIVLLIMGLMAYWLIKAFGIYSYPILFIIAGIPLFFIKVKDVEKDETKRN